MTLILVVEDERALRESLLRLLEREGYEATGVGNAPGAVQHLQESPVAIMLTDIRLPGMDGIALLREARRISPETRILMMTAFASVETAVEALREGAHDYLLKPLILDDVVAKVRHLSRYHELTRECHDLREEVRKHHDHRNVIGDSPPMREVFRLIDRIAPSGANVLITGESGTGKELVARALHHKSPAAVGNFIPINLSAVPRDLLESHLFGHERGAFTGAERAREGVLRAARSGTVFLDEIGELPLEVQPKLLRAIEEKEIFPVGRDKPLKVSVRILAATHRNLESMVAAGTFRQDLLYRLNVVRIHLPALRDRREDIPLLVDHFLKLHSRELGRPTPGIDPDAMDVLTSYEWKGNIRELSNLVERSILLGDGETVRRSDLPCDLVPGETTSPVDLETASRAFLRQHIGRVLDQTAGNRERAARLLGISEATLYRKLETCGLKGT